MRYASLAFVFVDTPFETANLQIIFENRLLVFRIVLYVLRWTQTAIVKSRQRS